MGTTLQLSIDMSPLCGLFDSCLHQIPPFMPFMSTSFMPFMVSPLNPFVVAFNSNSYLRQNSRYGILERLNDDLIKFIEQQQMYFVATAAQSGRINLSPKGLDSFRIQDLSLIHI